MLIQKRTRTASRFLASADGWKNRYDIAVREYPVKGRVPASNEQYGYILAHDSQRRRKVCDSLSVLQVYRDDLASAFPEGRKKPRLYCHGRLPPFTGIG